MEPHGINAEEPIQQVPDMRGGPVVSGRKGVPRRLPEMGIDPYYPVQFRNGEYVRLEEGMATRQATPKFLAIGTSRPMTPEQRDEHMLADVTATLQLYLDGKIDQFWHRYDGKGVIFVMTTGSQEEAEALLKALPLGLVGILSFELIPIGPLRPIAALLGAAKPSAARIPSQTMRASFRKIDEPEHIP